MVLPERPADRVGIARSCRVRLVLHPRQAILLTGIRTGAAARSNIVGGAGMRTSVGRQRRPDQLNGSEGGPIFQRLQESAPATSAPLRDRAEGRCSGERSELENLVFADFRRAIVWSFAGLKRMHGNERQCPIIAACVRKETPAPGSRVTSRQNARDATATIRTTHLPFLWS